MGRKRITRYAFLEKGTLEEKLQSALKLFELDGAATQLPFINNIVQKEKLNFYEGLERLLGEELSEKEDLRIERWNKQAKFPTMRRIEDFDFNHPTNIDKKKVLTLLECSWIPTGGNVIFLGPSGLGKTHLSIVLGLSAIEKNYETKYTTIERLTEAISVAMGKDKQEGGGQNRKKLLSIYINVPLLIIDEVALTDNLNSSEVAGFLFQIIYGRHEKGLSMILASNKSFKEWGPVFGGDNTRANAAVDRIMEGGIVVNIQGKSYRQIGFEERP
jgi:DNA replication protein DnaC